MGETMVQSKPINLSLVRFVLFLCLIPLFSLIYTDMNIGHNIS